MYSKNKFFGIAAMILAILFVTACDNGNTPETTKKPDTTKTKSVAQPTATPAGGNYTTAQTVTLATTTSDAAIFYTLDGTKPSTGSTYYTNAITISSDTTIKAIAIKTGMTASDVLTEKYTIVSSTSTPGTPANVTATAQSSSSIRITWSAPSSGGTPTRYNIWRSTSSSGTYTEVGYVSGSTTSYTDTGLSASTLYYYKVDAENSAGRSLQSSYVYAMTSSGSATTPGTPTNVSVIPQSTSSALITWNAPSSGGTPTFYNIWRSTSSNGTYTEVGYVSGSTTSYTNNGLSSYSTYYYKVDAENSTGRSPQSSSVYVVPYLSTLTSGVWRTGSLISSNDQVWFSFTVTNGTTYRIWVDDTDSYSSSKTADVQIMAYYSNGTQIWSYKQDSNWSTAASFTANSSGTVYIKVEPYDNSSSKIGSFGIVYSTSTTRPAQ